MRGSTLNKAIKRAEKIFFEIGLCLYSIFDDVIQLMFCKIDRRTAATCQHTFDHASILSLNATNLQINLMPYFVRRNMYENPLLILSFCQNHDLYVNETAGQHFNRTKN